MRSKKTAAHTETDSPSFNMQYALFALVLSTCVGYFVRSEVANVQGRDSPLDHVATKSAYAPWQTAYINPPESCTPIHMNLVSRHGSRYASDGDDVIFMKQIMREAGELHLWKVPEAVDWFDDFVDGKWGQLAESGELEMKELGGRMAHNFKNLFHFGDDLITVHATEKLRCQQSADAFLSGLPLNSSRVKRNYETCGKGDSPPWSHTQLRFFDDCVSYQNYKTGGTWSKELDTFRSKGFNQTDISKIFEKMFGREPHVASARERWLSLRARSTEILDSVYALCQTQASVSHTASQWCSLFTADNLKTISRLEYCEDLSSFYQKGSVQPHELACPLMLDLHDTIEMVVNESYRGSHGLQDRYAAALRFAHAETLMPLLVLLEPFNGSSLSPPTAQNYDRSGRRTWRTQKLFPMAANLQMILYQCSSAPKYRVKTLVNEGEVTLNACQGELFCDWTTVKAMLQNTSCTAESFNGKELCEGTRPCSGKHR